MAEGQTYVWHSGTSYNGEANAEVIAQPNGTSKKFNFGPIPFPKLDPPLWDTVEVVFEFRDSLHSAAFLVSRARADHYSTYPRLGNDYYYHLPIAKATVGGIGRELFDNDSLLKTKTDSLEKLIAFVRNGFEYRTDLETCGIEHFSLSAEEVLAGRGADCEDKVALLWQLQKELIGLPMVVLEFETHVSLAIAAPYNEFYADPIEYEGEKFYIADPSIEKDSPESNLPMIGSWPFGLFGLPFDFGPSWAPGD